MVIFDELGFALDKLSISGIGGLCVVNGMVWLVHYKTDGWRACRCL